jgi:hypothetical protein
MQCVASQEHAYKQVLEDTNRWLPPKAPPRHTLPSDSDVAACDKRHSPTMVLSPRNIWAATFNLYLHRFCKVPTVSKCFSFGALTEGGLVLLVSEKHRSCNTTVACTSHRSDDGLSTWFLDVLIPLEITTARREMAYFFEAVHDEGREIPLLAYDVEWNRQSKRTASIITTTEPQQVCLMKKPQRRKATTTAANRHAKRHCSSSSTHALLKELPEWVHQDDDFSDGEAFNADVGPVVDACAIPPDFKNKLRHHATLFSLDF